MKSDKIILAYGRRWDRKLSEKYDFKDIPENAEGRRSGIYILFKDKIIYYIGKSLSGLRNRIKQHTKDKHRNNWDSYTIFFTRKRFTSELEGIMLKMFWKVKDVTVDLHSPKIKAKKIEQDKEIKKMKAN